MADIGNKVKTRKSMKCANKEIMGVKHAITEDIRANQLRLYGHVQRMNEHCIPKQVINCEPHDKKEKGKTQTKLE